MNRNWLTTNYRAAIEPIAGSILKALLSPGGVDTPSPHHSSNLPSWLPSRLPEISKFPNTQIFRCRRRRLVTFVRTLTA